MVRCPELVWAPCPSPARLARQGAENVRRRRHQAGSPKPRGATQSHASRRARPSMQQADKDLRKSGRAAARPHAPFGRGGKQYGHRTARRKSGRAAYVGAARRSPFCPPPRTQSGAQRAASDGIAKTSFPGRQMSRVSSGRGSHALRETDSGVRSGRNPVPSGHRNGKSITPLALAAVWPVSSRLLPGHVSQPSRSYHGRCRAGVGEPLRRREPRRRVQAERTAGPATTRIGLGLSRRGTRRRPARRETNGARKALRTS